MGIFKTTKNGRTNAGPEFLAASFRPSDFGAELPGWMAPSEDGLADNLNPNSESYDSGTGTIEDWESRELAYQKELDWIEEERQRYLQDQREDELRRWQENNDPGPEY